MLWDLIRDFFVEHVFGGTTSLGATMGGAIGYFQLTNSEGYVGETLGTLSGDYLWQIGNDNDGITYSITMGDWLSTTATAISITIIVVLCCMFVYKIVKLIGGLIR